MDPRNDLGQYRTMNADPQQYHVESPKGLQKNVYISKTDYLFRYTDTDAA